jgi:glutamine synthetase
MKDFTEMNPNPLVQYLNKPAEEFSRLDIMKYIENNPFTEIPTLDIICSYFNKDGEPLESSPEYILKKADRALKEKTGFELQAMGELEYYITVCGCHMRLRSHSARQAAGCIYIPGS